MRHSPVYWLTCALAIAAIVPAAMATTIIMPSDDALVAKTPLIVTATVTSSDAVERDGKIWTETILSVESALKGDAPATLTVREVGGIVGDHITKVWGTPSYAAGERVLAFLTPTPRGDYQTVDLFIGKFSAAQTLDGGKLWLRDDDALENVTLLDGSLAPVDIRGLQRDAAKFERFIRVRAIGGFAPNDYGIENPVIDRGDFHDRPGGLQAVGNFTMISEPAVYRWFAFDNGGIANWYSYGTQPGYAGNGVNELQTAMAVWTSYTAAKIRYMYAGTLSGPPGGLQSPNGKNEVLFNDPKNEIAGSWNPSTGGVVGQGGFNGVGGTASWTSPFSADGSHPQKTYSAWNITEGNLTIQDNVSPGAGISSKVLAEIVAHEFGHTLGFGHSADSTALMYATVTGLGPSLRTDDQTAASWLYPNGSASPPPPVVQLPVAPSNLTASGASSTIALQWKDNAANESGEYIYLATATSSFSRVGSAPAGQTSVTLTGVAAGSYRVYVTAYNSAGESAASNIATATVGSPALPPVAASFDFTPAAPTTGMAVTFTDRSSGSPASWSWSFGDGTGSTSQNPSHAFAAPGTYSVTMTASNGSSSSTATRQVTVTSVVLPFRSLVSVAAQTNGASGSVWRTELTLFNGGSDGAQVQLTLIPASGTVQSRALFLSPKQAVTYNNVLFDLFGVSSGSGALAVEATSPASTPALRVSSRTFTNSATGTYGQAVPDVASSDLQRTLYLTGLELDAAFRTNIGIVNRSTESVPLTLRLFGAAGNSIGTATVTVGPNTFRQDSLATFFPMVNGGSYDVLSMRAETGAAAAISVYASVIDNRTQDPVYVQGAPLPAASQLIIPTVGRTAGANGTSWRSDLTLFNATGSMMNVYARYFAAGADNRSAARKALSVASGRTVVLRDLMTHFGFGASGVGALELTWDGGTPPVVFSRTYTTNAAGGTYGQSTDAVSSFGRDAFIVGLRSDFAFRSNLGFVNSGDQPIGADITLLGSAGQPLAAAFVALQPKSQLQSSVAALFPRVDVSSLGTFTVQAHTNASATLFAYGSIVDNVSGDPVFFGGK